MINLSSLIATLEIAELLRLSSVFRWNQSIKTSVASQDESACPDELASEGSCSF